uniref:hypothetical protein n=1 Tax=Cephaleuros karstenii TaxID=1985640 RepID=UPI001EE06AD3|nr:hypothetical protein MFR52_pgp085 [Cephaleuros karstenii]UIB39074.1 hypothetical protein [Cephaleuros karstenii]
MTCLIRMMPSLLKQWWDRVPGNIGRRPELAKKRGCCSPETKKMAGDPIILCPKRPLFPFFFFSFFFLFFFFFFHFLFSPIISRVLTRKMDKNCRQFLSIFRVRTLDIIGLNKK